MADRIAELYQIASKKGVLAEGLTEDMFREQTKTDEGLRSFYDYASQNGMNLTEWPTFRGKARGEIMDDLPQQPPQPANPSSAQPAGVSGGSLLDEQAELARQNAIQGATNDPNQPFVAPLDDNQAYQEQMLRTSEAMRRNAERMAQPAQLEAQIEGIKRWSRSKKKIVWFVLEDGTELPLRDIGDGMYMTLAPDVMTGVYFGFTKEYLEVSGAKRVEKPSASV